MHHYFEHPSEIQPSDKKGRGKIKINKTEPKQQGYFVTNHLHLTLIYLTLYSNTFKQLFKDKQPPITYAKTKRRITKWPDRQTSGPSVRQISTQFLFKIIYSLVRK